MKFIKAYIRLWIATLTYKLVCLKEFFNDEYEDEYRWFRFWEAVRFSHERRSWFHKQDLDLANIPNAPDCNVHYNPYKGKYVRVVKPKAKDYERD